MEFLDRFLICADCGGEFIFTAGEQLFFFDKQFKNAPKHCNTSFGLGLLNMSERVKLVGGQLEIKSAPEEGTEVWVEVPDGRSYR
jgi:signal transduction histidine kinase